MEAVINNKQSAWYLVQCKPREGFRAAEHLANQHIETFHPTHSVSRRRAGRQYWQTESLFPHYLFVKPSPEQSISAINSTRGVARVVNCHGKPLVVPEMIVAGVKNQCLVMRDRSQNEPMLKAGTLVTITEGCFKHLQAIVQMTRGEDRVILLMQLLSKEQRLELPLSSVQVG
ncbi:transcription termination/antitermination NusG family protein [Saccharospirillum sp. HFRX-1]